MNCLFSVDLMLIDASIHTFLNKTPPNNFPFESFPLVQFLLVVLSVKVTYTYIIFICFDSSDIGERSLSSLNAGMHGIIPCSSSWYYTLTVAWDKIKRACVV